MKWLNTWVGRQERSKPRETQWQNLRVCSSWLISSGIGVGFESKQQWNECKHACVYKAEICTASDLLSFVLGLSVTWREREKRTHRAVRAWGKSYKQVGTWSTDRAVTVCPHILTQPRCCWSVIHWTMLAKPKAEWESKLKRSPSAAFCCKLRAAHPTGTFPSCSAPKGCHENRMYGRDIKFSAPQALSSAECAQLGTCHTYFIQAIHFSSWSVTQS